MSSEVKQVKVDNWGIYFLQRLKHFFNRTDYCDLTLQFQDNAQLKVHRLVLSACTEYFELLERTCEMYEDCLVMPDDLQADVVVPIVNFMYTGHLEFRMDLLERLYQTSQILNMPVLSKLLESHRVMKTPTLSYGGVKRFTKHVEPAKIVKPTTSNKRSYSKAFESSNIVYREKKVYHPHKIPDPVNSTSAYTHGPPSPTSIDSPVPSYKKVHPVDPRPTRYEIPEELDNDNIFDNSFCNISYTCKPLMIHPETVKRYSSKKSGLFSDASTSKQLSPGTSTVDIVECKRIPKRENIFDDGLPDRSLNDDLDMFQTYSNDSVSQQTDSSQLFDQILDDGPKVTIETKDNKAAANLDHAKIISEVLKKYPHLVKSHKNIKLKILNTPGKAKKVQKYSPTYIEEQDKKPKLKTEEPDYTYETDVIDSQQAVKLIAMGAENTKGPWICLICGTPGKALHFTSYYKFRRHLVEVHNEKPISNICEYCGLRSLKRNYLQHHLYAQHGVEPPPQYNFPKCNKCNYIALTERLLVKHKMTHKDVKNFRCNVCSALFVTTKQLLQHIQATGHKYSAERKTNLQCIYCLKAFLRDGNLYAHLKTCHKKEAKNDGIIEDSDDEKHVEEMPRHKTNIKYEPSTSYDNEYDESDMQYQIQPRHSGDMPLTPRKQHYVISKTNTPKQKILNPGFGSPKPAIQKANPVRKAQHEQSNFLDDMNIPSPVNSSNQNEDEIVLIDNIEYIMRDNQLIPKKSKNGGNEYVISDMIESASLEAVQPTTSLEYTNVHNTKLLEETPSNIVMKKTTNINHPIQIVVSNEEEYKALMSSNHPILFDNGDANKTLTVLTAPHNTTIESTTIDLNNTQGNDMMIIQEDFPLNVTEAVSTDNSNIVVVYSHPVDDQNKQFQILTTGGIGSQFVQSSAIITQNYETVTTSAAPAVSAHVLEPQADTSWRENIRNEVTHQVPVEAQEQLQDVVEHVEITPQNESSDNLKDLPEVHLGPESEIVVPQETESNDNMNVDNSEHVNQIIEQESIEMSNNMPDIMEPNIIRESVIQHEAIPVNEHVVAVNEHMEISHESIPEVLASNSKPETVAEPMQTDSCTTVEQETVTVSEMIPQEEPIVEAVTQHENTEIEQSTDLNINNAIEDAQIPQSQAYDDIVEVNHISKEDAQTYPKETVEKIQDLASEWSEEEYDVAQEVPTAVANIPKPEEDMGLESPLAETIENIQREVHSHLNTISSLAAAAIQPVPEEENKSDNIVPDDAVPSPEELPLLPVTQSTAVTQNDPETQEKISSLLNDWEDNDSQEENNSDVPTAEEKQPESDMSEKLPDINKTDNIKSLVSDWDEEDEDKENI